MFYKAGNLEHTICIHKNPLGTEEEGRVGKDTLIRNGLGAECDKAKYFIKKLRGCSAFSGPGEAI